MPDLDLEPHEYRRDGVDVSPVEPKVEKRIDWLTTAEHLLPYACGVWAACSLLVTRQMAIPWWQGVAWAFGPGFLLWFFFYVYTDYTDD